MLPNTPGAAVGEGYERPIDRLYMLLGALQRNGNILGTEYPIYCAGNELTAFVILPEEDALDEVHLNDFARQAMAKLNQLCSHSFHVLGKVAEDALICSCSERSAFALFTTYLTIAPALRCVDCFGYVPLYRIPPEEDCRDFSGLLFWESNYRACDTLQMNCSTGERFATREMSDVNSSLSVRGHDVCADIEKRTGKPTYYYLYRGSGRSVAAERQRKCPKCQGTWLLETPMFEKFDFRCDACHLISNVAFSVR